MYNRDQEQFNTQSITQLKISISEYFQTDEDKWLIIVFSECQLHPKKCDGHYGGGDLQVTGLSVRLCLLSVVLTAWLIIVFYTSVLMSSLAVPLLSPPFKDMHGLLMAGTHNLGLQEGNSEVERMRTSQDPVLQKVWSDIVLQDPTNLVPSANEGIRRILKERFAFLMDLEYFAYHRGSDCRLFPLPDHIFTYGAGMAVRKGSPLRLVFNDQVLQQQVTGITDRNRKRHLPSPPLCAPDGPEALGLGTLLTSFLLLAAASVVALLVLFLEVVYSRHFKRTDSAGDNRELILYPLIV
nr:glutamate receptor ionotropic, delta-2-like [Penaeus vannamei]